MISLGGLWYRYRIPVFGETLPISHKRKGHLILPCGAHTCVIPFFGLANGPNLCLNREMKPSCVCEYISVQWLIEWSRWIEWNLGSPLFIKCGIRHWSLNGLDFRDGPKDDEFTTHASASECCHERMISHSPHLFFMPCSQTSSSKRDWLGKMFCVVLKFGGAFFPIQYSQGDGYSWLKQAASGLTWG